MDWRSRLGSKRFSATIPAPIMEALEHRAKREGRSVSNLVAYLLESHLDRELPPSEGGHQA